LAETPGEMIAEVRGELKGVNTRLDSISSAMATKEGSSALTENIRELRLALSDERDNRTKEMSDAKVAAAETHKQLSADTEKVAERLLLVEDKMENRRYQFYIAIGLGALGSIISVAIGLIVGGPA